VLAFWQPVTFPTQRAHYYDITMTVCTMGARHYGTVDWMTVVEFFCGSHRLLHQMGGGRTIGHHH
jgi:hypothetical protein